MQVLFTEYTGGPGKLPEKARAIMEAAVSTAISHPNLVSRGCFEEAAGPLLEPPKQVCAIRKKQSVYPSHS